MSDSNDSEGVIVNKVANSEGEACEKGSANAKAARSARPERR